MLDIKGKKLNMLTAVSFFERKNNQTYWLFKCDCGNDTITTIGNFNSQHTKSCGCKQKVFSTGNKRHGLSNTRLFRIHNNMIRRCYCINSNGYCYYGERGVEVCQEWLNSIECFYEWAISNGYDSKLTLDRIDVNGNYDPGNCRWATFAEQNRNLRRNKYYEYNGEMMIINDIAKITGINESTLYHRLMNHTLEKALSMGIHFRK